MKDIILKPNPDNGREQSTISWEHDFMSFKRGSVTLKFEDFKPFYRGKLAEDVKPLSLDRIKRFSIMARRYVVLIPAFLCIC
jgi:Complex I intermediate-associated protein 30 (CIA30)